LAIHELYRIAQAALAQYVVSDRCALAAMRAPVDWTVVIRLLADPYAICDFCDNRATDRTMCADVLPGRNRRARGRWRTGLRVAYAAERKIAESRKCAGSDTGTLEEATSIKIAT
jgi:hypothetical protein